jgi:hypothetical protein
MSDRGLRRLFDRLVALGGVRELTIDVPTLWAPDHGTCQTKKRS